MQSQHFPWFLQSVARQGHCWLLRARLGQSSVHSVFVMSILLVLLMHGNVGGRVSEAAASSRHFRYSHRLFLAAIIIEGDLQPFFKADRWAIANTGFCRRDIRAAELYISQAFWFIADVELITKTHLQYGN